MAQLTEEKSSRREFVTVKDAMELLERSDRQIRRMIANKQLTAIHDAHGGVWIDLHDVQRKSNGRLRSAVEELRGRVREQLNEQAEAIDFLKVQMADQAQTIQRLTMSIGHLQETIKRIVTVGAVSEQREDVGVEPSLVLHDMTRFYSLLSTTDLHHSRLEKRGLLAGTRRLATFAEHHQVSIDVIKGLYGQGAIQLTIFNREAHATRNKQEWWINPQQQCALIQYWKEHNVSYTSCLECPHSYEEAGRIG